MESKTISSQKTPENSIGFLTDIYNFDSDEEEIDVEADIAQIEGPTLFFNDEETNQTEAETKSEEPETKFTPKVEEEVEVEVPDAFQPPLITETEKNYGTKYHIKKLKYGASLRPKEISKNIHLLDNMYFHLNTKECAEKKEHTYYEQLSHNKMKWYTTGPRYSPKEERTIIDWVQNFGTGSWWLLLKKHKNDFHVTRDENKLRTKWNSLKKKLFV
eukprot:GAHX01001886.1.p1 GENE.GAHX01001886.1~~GAHX01001886.1.p1  ORF type:complete len:216 (-),score=45.01 GAHX01001886.1:83-730(-)